MRKERAKRAIDGCYFPPTASTPGITVRVSRPAHMILVLVQLSKLPPDQLYTMTGDVNAIFELPFHLRPPVPERSFWISPQEAYPLAENRRTMWRPTRYASPGTSTAHSISYATNGNRWIGTGKVQEARLEIWS